MLNGIYIRKLSVGSIKSIFFSRKVFTSLEPRALNMTKLSELITYKYSISLNNYLNVNVALYYFVRERRRLSFL